MLWAAIAGALALPCPAADSTLPPPPGVSISITGTANFQGNQTALVEDLNTHSAYFYNLGDSVYGYRINSISGKGITLERGGRQYFVALDSGPPPAAAAPARPTVTANTYLPDKPGSPNFYTSGPTGWDIYTDRPRRDKAAADAAASPAKPGEKPAAAGGQVAVGAAGGRFSFPVASSGFKKLTSRYGYRRHPIGGRTKMHTGLDLSARTGTKIFSADAGVVTFSGWRGGYGYCIEVDHRNGFKTLYGHCSARLVDVGDNVKRGALIGKVGSTGVSTGPHLHFEVRKGTSPVDPLPYLSRRG